MNRTDVWAERRELIDYVLKEHVRRGGRVIMPQQSPADKVLDTVNVSALLMELQKGATVDVARLAGPPPAIAACLSAPGALDNPFGPPPGAVASSISLPLAPGSNPFGSSGSPPAATVGAGSFRHAHKLSTDNPFGAGAPNQLAAGGAADAGVFGKKAARRGGATDGGGAEPPVASMATSTKLSYSTGNLAAAGQAARRAGDQGDGEGADGEEAAGVRPPKLELPQLETGQTDDQLRDLAFLLFAAAALGSGLPQHAALLPVMRQQLFIDEARAADVKRVLRHVLPGGESPHIMDQLHPEHTLSSYGGAGGGWRPSQRASLELLLRLITVVRPTDFEAATPAKAFRSFLRWKDVTVAVLEQQIASLVAEGWSGDKAQLRHLLARMHGAARRADVRGEADFEEEEYGEATRVFAGVAAQLAGGCAGGMRFPWAVRVRVCEILVTALFDTIDEGTYIDEAALVQQFLDSTLWPALGVSEPASLAVSAWVHFSMYVATGCKEQRLVKHLKAQIGRLAAVGMGDAKKNSDTFGLGAEAVGVPAAPPPPDELPRDRALASEVANQIVDFSYARVSDYHAAFPKGDMGPMLDIFVFASKSRGDGAERLAELLVEAVCSSTAAQLARQMRARVSTGGSNEARLLELASVVHDIHDADAASYCSVALAPHMGEALGLACVQLHTLYGQHLIPWLNGVSGINAAVLDVFRTASALESRLAGPIAAAVSSGAAAAEAVAAAKLASGGGAAGAVRQAQAVADVLSGHSRWDLTGPLQSAMLQWVTAQVAGMNTWLARSLAAEKWRPMGAHPETAHTQSAADVSRMTTEAIDALYGMDVPFPPEVPRALMDGIDALLRKYATYINDKLGAVGRLIPPLPPTTRYKKDVVLKVEMAELEAAKVGTKAAKKAAFVASVAPVETSPDFTNISAALTTDALAAAACSLHYLQGRAEVLLQSFRDRAAQSAAVHSSAASTPSSSPHKAPAKQQSAASPGSAASAEPEPLSQARAALLTGVQYACKFLATRVIFWDQRFGWLELLYRHHALSPASRIDPLLGGLHKALDTHCPAMPDAVRTAFARHLLIAVVQAIERVFLDGGPCRWFIPTDVNTLDQDLQKVRALFLADGEGLDREVVDAEMERARRLLPLMRVEVGPLMDLLKTARTHGTAQLAASGTAYDESTLMRVIARRPERNGSKLLKTMYKLSKRMK